MPVQFDISPLITPPAGGSVPQQPTPPPAVSPMLPPMPKRSHQLLQWSILVAAGLFLIAVASLWWGGNSFSDKGVTLTIQASDRATSGDEIIYTVTWKNDTRLALQNMSFRLFYPEGSIVLKDGAPTTPESEGFTIDQLNPGASDQREFKVFLVGDKGAIKMARVNLIFSAGNLQSSFQKEATASTTITALPVTLTLVAPPTSVSGQPIQYILDARNDSGQDLSDLKVVLKYPDGFVVQKMQPNPDEGNTVWHLNALKAGEGTRITVNGTLQGQEREAKTVSAVLQRNLNGQYVDYVRTESFTMISSPLLSVTIQPNQGRDYVSFPGDTLRYTVTYGNNSKFSLLGLMLGVKLEGDMYDFTQLRSQEGFFDAATNTLAFDAAGVPALANLQPGQTGRLTFSVPLKPGVVGQLGGAKSIFVKATARLSTTNVPTGVDGPEIFTLDSIITKIGSQPNLTQAALYDSGAGTGPLPPQVGQETTFTIRWQLTNPGNDARDTNIVATLPPGVTWKNSTTVNSGSVPAFDVNRRTVTWTVGLLPFGTGNGTQPYQATFIIAIKPAVNQQGQSVPLVAGATLTGTDAFTGQAVQTRLRDMTTDNVEHHPDDGRVQ